MWFISLTHFYSHFYICNLTEHVFFLFSLNYFYLITFLYTHFQPSMYFLSIFFSLSINLWYCTFLTILFLFHGTQSFPFSIILIFFILHVFFSFSLYFYYHHGPHPSHLLLSSLSFVHVRCYPSRCLNNLISSIPFLFTMLLYASLPVSLILLFPSHPPAPPSHQSIIDPSASPPPP